MSRHTAGIDVEQIRRQVRRLSPRAASGARRDRNESDNPPRASAASLPRWTGVGQPQSAQDTGSALRLDSLLSNFGEQFVTDAYAQILNRAPDPSGLTSYASRLQAGTISRVEVLGRLRYSSEGRRVGRSIPGLAGRFLAQTLCRLPLMGPVLRVVWGVARLPQLARNLESLHGSHAHLEKRLGDYLPQLNKTLEDSLQRLRVERDSTETRLDKIQGTLQGALQQLHDIQSSVLAQQARSLVELSVARRLLEAQTNKLEEQLLASQSQSDQKLAGLLSRVHDLERQRWQEASPRHQSDRAALPHTSAADRDVERNLASADMDRYYVEFEDQFRGSSEQVREASTYALEYIRDAIDVESDKQARVVDIGCGRGEFVELLREAGIDAYGVDSNASMVARCRGRNVPAVLDDGGTHLSELPEEQLAALTAFHVIEHLDVQTLKKFIGHCQRVLRPGGILILETPNPENLIVGACNFYFDLTHRNPIPPSTLSHLVEAHGFEVRTVERLHPPARPDWLSTVGDGLHTVQSLRPLQQLLSDLFYSAQDYAVVAVKR